MAEADGASVGDDDDGDVAAAPDACAAAEDDDGGDDDSLVVVEALPFESSSVMSELPSPSLPSLPSLLPAAVEDEDANGRVGVRDGVLVSLLDSVAAAAAAAAAATTAAIPPAGDVKPRVNADGTCERSGDNLGDTDDDATLSGECEPDGGDVLGGERLPEDANVSAPEDDDDEEEEEEDEEEDEEETALAGEGGEAAALWRLLLGVVMRTKSAAVTERLMAAALRLSGDEGEPADEAPAAPRLWAAVIPVALEPAADDKDSSDCAERRPMSSSLTSRSSRWRSSSGMGGAESRRLSRSASCVRSRQ